MNQPTPGYSDFFPMNQSLDLWDLLRKKSCFAMLPLLELPESSQAAFTYTGTTALGIAAKCLKKKGCRQLLVPTFNCGHEIEPFVRHGYDIRTYCVDRQANVDTEHIASLLNGGQQVLLVTHYFGFPQRIQQIHDLCKYHKVYLLEDCAHSYMSRVDDRKIGSWGDLAIYSFRKCLPAPDGGALVIHNPEIRMEKPSDAPKTGAVLKKSGELLLKHFLVNAYDVSKFAFSSIWTIKRWMGRIHATLRQRAATNNLNFYSPDDESYDYDARIFEWRISAIARRVFENSDHKAIMEKRRANFQYVLDQVSGATKFRPIHKCLPEGTCPLVFPMIATGRDLGRIYQVMSHFPMIYKWWSGFHPSIQWDAAGYGRWLKERCYFIPIHQDMRKRQLDYLICACLEVNRRL